MIKKTKRKSNSSAGTWHKLAPKSSRRPASMAALKKRAISISKFFALVIILGIIGLGVWFFSSNQNNYSGPIDLTGPAVPVSKLVFISDGVLHRNWFQNWFGPFRNRSLMDFDIVELQNELTKEPQISFVRVSRIFPATLKIEIQEKKPILRLCLRSKTSGEKTWLVSKDGNMYKGACYRKSSLSHLPYLDLEPSLLKFKSNKKSYEKLEGIPAVAPLLEIARKEYPGFYQDWQVLSYHRPYDDDPGAYVKINSKKIKELRFSPSDYENQLRRLKFLLTDQKFKSNSNFESIDLSHDRSVFAKLGQS
ncbi:MAG: FtsQ-type POTRA domain-containing protein [Opitutae bacterium]|nr:FtsQ-type POTRA domain-containing protein [Opitutae bacterium]